MKLSRRTNTIILWTISLGLLVSMVIAFTPSLGTLFGGGNGQSQTALEVNGVKVTELELARAQQNPPFNLSLEGEAGDDLDTLLVDSLVNNALIQQAAKDTRVSNREVNEAVNEFRESQGVAGSRNDRNYLSLIGRFGYTDATFRDFYRDQLRVEKYQEGITDDIEVSDEEVQAYYELNEQNYQSEERILARAIVVEEAEAADAAYERVLAGEDFATLAEELSVERADRGGALGAGEGSSDPQAVGRAALPTEVANAAFGLQSAGTTEVVSAGNQYYIVNVEEYIPAGTEPFEEVAEEVREDALAAKRAGVLEQTLNDLRANADLSLPETSALSLDDPAVATVGDEEIKRSELARSVYLNPQIQQSLSGDNASLITGLFKPSILEQLISQKLAYQGAQDLDATFIGPEAQVAQNALSYVSREAVATDEDLNDYYESNQASFTVPAQAVVTRVNFASEDDASGFRAALLDGEDLQTSAESVSGEVLDLGTVRPGTLQPEIDTALFGTEAFSPLPESDEEISDILVLSEPVVEEPDEVSNDTVDTEEGEGDAEEGADDSAEAEETSEASSEEAETTEDEASEESASEEGDEAAESDTEEVLTENVYVVLVAERTPERVRSFDEVRAQVEDTVLQNKRNELQTAWLDGLREEIPVENLLEAEAETDDADFETTPLDETPGDDTEDGAESGEEDSAADSAEGDAGDVDTNDETAGEAVDEASSEAADADATSDEAVEETTDTEEAESTSDDASDSTEETPADDSEDTPEEEDGADNSNGLDTLIAAATATVGDSVNLEQAETRAAEFTDALRPLANREDLSSAQQAELATLTANLEKVQAEVVEFTGSQGTYTVQSGDTLSSIAREFYEDSSEWETILEANNYLIDDPDLIFPGFILLIPAES